MEACEEFSEKMELHADDIEYFYIESKRVTARREQEKESLRQEIDVLQGEKEELRRKILDLKTENLQLKEMLVKSGEAGSMKTPTVEVTAQLVQGGLDGPQILLGGLQGVKLEEDQVQFIRQQVVRELVKVQEVAEQSKEVPPTKVVLFLPSSSDWVNLGNHQRQENLPLSNARASVDGALAGQVADVLAFSSVPGSGQEMKQEEVRASTQESESGSIVSSAGENSSYYSANSILGEAKGVTEATDLEEERISVPDNAHLDSRGKEEELGAEQMQKLVFGSISTRVAAKPAFSSELPTLLLDEPNASGKMGHTQESKVESKKHKSLREEATSSRRSSRRLSKLVSDGSRTEVEEMGIGEASQKRARLRKQSSEIEDTTVDCEGDAGRDEEENEKIACEENREEIKRHRKKVGRGMFDSAMVTPIRKPTIVDEIVPKSSGKKRRKCLYGADCRGCSAPECGECAFCLDKPSRGGPGTKKQKCLLRKCRLEMKPGSEMDVGA